MRKSDNYCMYAQKQFFQKFAVTTFLITFSVVCFSTSGCSHDQPVSDGVIQDLLQNPKLLDAEAILQNFIDGKSTTRVIVNLRDPAGNGADRDRTGDDAWTSAQGNMFRKDRHHCPCAHALEETDGKGI